MRAKRLKQSKSLMGGGDPVAVIELGTTSIRMVIAEITRGGKFRVLDTLQQVVSLGRDTFTDGQIARSTVEACVAALRSFQKVMREYGIVEDRHVRAIATSAVREAENRDALVDRIQIATGIQVAIIDEAEISRLTYLAVRPVLMRQPFFKKSDTLVLEVGGGSTEALMFKKGKVGNSHMYRLGSLRLMQMLGEYNAPRARAVGILSSATDSTIDQISSSLQPAGKLHMLALGSDTRFAGAILHPEWDKQSPIRLKVSALEVLTHKLLQMTTDALVKRYKMSFQEAGTVGPALLIYVRLARALKLRHILVAEVNLRSGLLAEMATGGAWTAEFKRQIMNSAIAVGRHYHVDLRHARHVASYAQKIFDYLREEHRLNARDEMILAVASLLHESGLYVSNSSHHKHSFYLILNSDIFGLGSRDLLLAALVARYHRGATPRPGHDHYASLPRESRLTVNKLSAILRVANALDRNHSVSALDIELQYTDEGVRIAVRTRTDITMVQHRVNQRSELFEQVYGTRVAVCQHRKET
ncbi:MAG: exopolyphosphatase [Verrucomicrobia bacterium]|jgi:exopolyphosphatase / guanosine-5'-triphosphate,3'-diphosphate pyrophosphatase|nr:exopolyphosphatase [Verrucomicrobiota bacterium]